MFYLFEVKKCGSLYHEELNLVERSTDIKYIQFCQQCYKRVNRNYKYKILKDLVNYNYEVKR